MGVLVNKAEVAGAYGVSLPTVDRWCQQGLPAEQRGGKGSQWVFDLDKVKAWRDERDREVEAAVEAKRQELEDLQAELDLRRSVGDAADQLPLTMREQYYRAESKREELARRRGFLVETAEVRREFDICFGYLSDRLQTLPDVLERHCALTPEMVDAVQKAVEEWQTELARMMQQAEIDARQSAAA